MLKCTVNSTYVILSINYNSFQAEDGIRDVERSRGLGDVYKRQFLYFNMYDTIL